MSIFLFVLLALAAYLVPRIFLGYPQPSHAYRVLAPREIAFLRAAIDAMFPTRGAIPVSGSDVDAPRYVDSYVDVLHRSKALQVRLLLCFFEQATLFWWAPGVRGWRRFSSLSLQQRIAVLESWNASRFFLRRLVFTAMRAILVLAYLGHPATLRHLRLAPYDFKSPVLEADLLYPPIGQGPDAIPYTVDELTPPSDGTPLDLDGPIHPDFSETPL